MKFQSVIIQLLLRMARSFNTLRCRLTEMWIIVNTFRVQQSALHNLLSSLSEERYDSDQNIEETFGFKILLKNEALKSPESPRLAG